MAKKEAKAVKLTQEETHATEMHVYDKYQANLVDGKWEKNGAALQNTCKVYEGFTHNHNLNFETSGSFYVLNTKADKKYQEAVKAKRAKMGKTKKAKTEK